MVFNVQLWAHSIWGLFFCDRLQTLVVEMFQVASQAHISTLLHFHVQIKDNAVERPFWERFSVWGNFYPRETQDILMTKSTDPEALLPDSSPSSTIY